MSIIFASTVLMLLSAALAVLLRRELAETVVPSAALVIIVLFCFGSLNFENSLAAGLIALTCLSAVSFLFICVAARREGFAVLRERKLAQGVALYLIFAALALFTSYGARLHVWDEFNHWGPRAKHLFMYDALQTYTPADAFSVLPPQAMYPPGAALWGYFFSRVLSGFSEWKLLFAQTLLPYILLIPLLKDIFKKGCRLSGIALSLIALFLFSEWINTLIVDMLLGILFGFALLYYLIFGRGGGVYGLVMTTATVLILALIKDTGFLLAIGVIAVIAADVLFFRRCKPLERLLYVAAPAVSAVAPYMAWTAAVKRSGAATLPPVTIADAANLLRGINLEQWQRETRRNMVFDTMLAKKVNLTPSLNVTFAVFIILFAAVWFALSLYRRGDISFRRNTVTGGLLLFGALLYQFVLLCVFEFTMLPREGVLFASYERYTLTYLLGITIACGVFFLPLRGAHSLPATRLHTLTTVMAALLSALALFTVKTKYLPRIYHPEYYRIRPTEIAANSLLPYITDSPAPLYVLSQGTQGAENVQLSYYLFTRRTNASRVFGFYGDWSAWSVAAEPYFPPANPGAVDLTTTILTPAEWETYIREYGFKLLYIYKSDEKFSVTYGVFFEAPPSDDTLYQVDFVSGQMKLRAVAR